MVHVFAFSTGQVEQVSKSLTIQARDCRLLHGAYLGQAASLKSCVPLTFDLLVGIKIS